MTMYFLRQNHLPKRRIDQVYKLPSIDDFVVDRPAPIKTVVSVKPKRSWTEPQNPDDYRQEQTVTPLVGTLHKVTRVSRS
jgi:hypothetical protein